MAEVEENNKNRSCEGDSESDPDPYFEPIIQLPEVQIPADEETAILLVKLRAKLYRFDSSNEDGPEWKERGTGELKLLRNKENHSCRIVMRRDKTFKVCANHFITPWMALKPSFGSDKAFVYTTAADFADEIAKPECLAVKFGTAEVANQFKEMFEEARRIVTTKCELYCKDENESSTEESENEEEEEEETTEEVVDKLAQLNVDDDKQKSEAVDK